MCILYSYNVLLLLVIMDTLSYASPLNATSYTRGFVLCPAPPPLPLFFFFFFLLFGGKKQPILATRRTRLPSQSW